MSFDGSGTPMPSGRHVPALKGKTVPGDFMQQRRLRLGDILDDYCPRERRITNHAVVAMIEDTVKQTRCTTCDAEHEYKHAKVPAARRRKGGVLGAQLVEGPGRLPATVEELPEEMTTTEEPL